MKQSNSEIILQSLAEKVFKKPCCAVLSKAKYEIVPKFCITWGNGDGFISLRSERLLLGGNELFFALKELLPPNIILKIIPTPNERFSSFIIQSNEEAFGSFISSSEEDLAPYVKKSEKSAVFMGGIVIFKSGDKNYAKFQDRNFQVVVAQNYIILGDEIMDTVKVDLILGTIAVPLENLLNLRPGDVIEISNNKEIPVSLNIGTYPIADGVLIGDEIKINKVKTKLLPDSVELSI